MQINPRRLLGKACGAAHTLPGPSLEFRRLERSEEEWGLTSWVPQNTCRLCLEPWGRQRNRLGAPGGLALNLNSTGPYLCDLGE